MTYCVFSLHNNEGVYCCDIKILIVFIIVIMLWFSKTLFSTSETIKTNDIYPFLAFKRAYV